MRKLVSVGLLLLLVLTVATGIVPAAMKKNILRVGYFPNITHSQALIGMADGSFQKELGPGVEIQSFLFNAGPSIIEAMMARQLDLAYIGPNPAINGYIKTKGTLLKIVAGAASGGAGLVLREDLQIKNIRQLAGCKLATPQLGNTQDVALRHFLKENNLKLAEQGGTVQVMPVANPDQLTLFQKKEIAGAWTVEPWVSRLIAETGGVLFIDERDLWPGGRFITANIIANQQIIEKHPEIIKKWLSAHVKITIKSNANLEGARKKVNEEIRKATGKALPDQIIEQAFTRFDLIYDPLRSSMLTSANHAFELGFLGKKKPDLSGIYDLRLLNQVLRDFKLPPVSE